MNNNDVIGNNAPSPAWLFQVKAAFGISAVGLLTGVAWLPLDPWKRSFLAMGTLFLVNSTFALAKTLRDDHESKRVHTRLDDARLVKLLAEHDPFRDHATAKSVS
jgi:hypothetical protein